MKNLLFLFICLLLCFDTYSQVPNNFDIRVAYIESDSNGIFYGASNDDIIKFDKEGIVLDTITTDFDETFGRLIDFRIGLDGKFYVLYDFNNGIYEMDSNGALTKVLGGRFKTFDVDNSGGILASIENGQEEIVRYVNGSIDTTYVLDDGINASNLIFDIEIDQNNTFWIGYAQGLLSMKDLELIRHNEESINDVFPSRDGRVYVTFDLDRAGYKESDEDEIIKIDFDDAYGRRIAADGLGNIFVNNSGIVYVFNANGWNEVEISSEPFFKAIDFEVSVDNTVAMTTNSGSTYIWESSPSFIKGELSTSHIQLSPNPAREFITIYGYSTSNLLDYNIQKLSGERILEGVLNQNEINITQLHPGLYILEIPQLDTKLKFLKF